jgi:hypothetical protein
MAEQPVGPRCGNNPNARLTDGDRKVIADFKTLLALKAAAQPYVDSAAWVDGDPLMEVIAATIWKHCARDDQDQPQAVCDDPRTIAAYAAAVARTQAEMVQANPVDRTAAALAAVRRLCNMTINDSIRTDAIDQARDTLAAIDSIMGDEQQPLSPYYEHPACGFHWHGKDGMDIPIRDGQPICPRCEINQLQAAADGPVSSPPPDQTALRERIAMTLARTKLRPPYLHCLAMADAVLAELPELAEAHRLALSEALGLGTGAPWDAIHDRATKLGLPPLAEDPVAQRLGLVPPSVDRAAVLLEAADAVFALDYDVMVGEVGDENFGSMREAWDVGTIHATELLRRLAAEAQRPDTAHSCSNCEGIDSDSCLMNPRRRQNPGTLERVRRLHDQLAEETDLASPDDLITRGAAAKRIAAAFDGWNPTGAAQCDVDFENGARCAKPAGHRPPGSDDPHVPAPVQHAPGKAVLCPDCRAKGHTICMPDEQSAAADTDEETCDGCGHPAHPARECPVTQYGERCACDEPIAIEEQGAEQ